MEPLNIHVMTDLLRDDESFESILVSKEHCNTFEQRAALTYEQLCDKGIELMLLGVDLDLYKSICHEFIKKVRLYKCKNYL